MARANYRQTCVNFHDGILQDTWHELNEFLRLCGVGLTGVAQWEYKDNPVMLRKLRRAAHKGANSMADSLKMPRPKNITTIKPSGTSSKIMDTTEGIHTPLGKYIFNNIAFGNHDPLLPMLKESGYNVFDKPGDADAKLVTFPVKWDNIDFTKKSVKRKNGDIVEVEVNDETAIQQLEQYKLVMENYVDQNCSITVSYSPDEVPSIVEWLYNNWDVYVGVSWLLRVDPTKTAADIGVAYLPQEVVTKEEYENYVAKLKPVDVYTSSSFEEIETDECAGGVCPIK